uniref:Pept_C1 domain-containing protein n=1 Tax=Angiostrongylus cantonensis TaxID=6313 RepID=A0A0K0DKG6_ANGCA
MINSTDKHFLDVFSESFKIAIRTLVTPKIVAHQPSGHGEEFISASVLPGAHKLSGAELVEYVNNRQQFFQAELSPLTSEQHKARLMHPKYLIKSNFNASKVEISDFDDEIPEACEGGGLIEAWEYFKQYGACSGGDYGEADVCKPYVFHPCGHHRKEKYYGKCPNHMFPTPSCKRVCQSGYNKSYEKDKIYGKSAYMVPNDETLIQKEIMKNGPVQAAFSVFEDFSHYKSGIYVHTAGQQDGGHAVKLIGWGVEGGIKYWLVANSWSVDWGENGIP